MLSKIDVEKIAHLARIKLVDTEVEKFQTELSTILDYVEDLKQVNTEGLAIVSTVTGLENVQRLDEAIISDKQEQIMKNAPERKDGYYQVRSIL